MNVDRAEESLISQLRAAFESCSGLPILPVGGGTKEGFLPATEFVRFPLSDHRGIIAYDPSEFLITARAGTPIREIQEALQEKNQFLPFDPLFSASGATLGGTLASGVSGPNRLLYGGARDFVMEVAMVDGLGKLVRGGGKVVKNAAGFDTPKMMVGSYGRMGIILEATLKVFPAPQGWATLTCPADSLEEAIRLSQQVLAKPFPVAGVDITPDYQLFIRLAAPTNSLGSAAGRLRELLGDRLTVLETDDHLEYQSLLNRWLEGPLEPNQLLAKISVCPNDLWMVQEALQLTGISEYRHCGAGTVTWLKFPRDVTQAIDKALSERALSGVVIRGTTDSSFIGSLNWIAMASRIQKAIDPQGYFLPWISASTQVNGNQ